MFKKLFTVVSLLIAFSMVLAACTPATTVVTQVVQQTQLVEKTTVVKETQVVEVTAPPEPTATPAPSTRTGAWVDQLVFSEQNDASAAVKQIQAGDIDIYAYSVADAAVFTEVKADPKLAYSNAVGSFNEITFNPAGPTFADGRLNPFSNPKIREAMNWLVDRSYIAQEIFGGLAVPKFVPTSSFFADYARYIDTIRALEVKYAYNPEQAKTVIDAEMTAMGATAGADGKWEFNGAPVTIIAIIRTEDARKQIGDYVCNQLETINFTCDRQYKTRSEASPIWNQSDPAEGKMHFYTGGWISTVISRDDSTNFGYYYTPLGSASPLWQAYKNVPEFYNGTDGCADKLWTNNFASMDERKALWDACLPLALQDSIRLWLMDQISFSPERSDLVVSYDLAGGVAGAQVYPYTIRLAGQEGGTVKIAQPGILVEPWNPIAGSNWIYDAMPQRATYEQMYMADPYTGLFYPLRFEKADVVVKEGLPVAKTLDWVNLSTAPSIEVPGDAWVDWDAKAQTFITASTKFTSTLTANTKTTISFPADFFTTVTWHDGSPISVGDFVMFMIMTFDKAKPDSANYDEAQVPTLDAFLSHFKGVVIESTDPLVITTYDDLYYLDAEWIAAYQGTWYPAYAFGGAPWQTVALGNLADASTDPATELAWSTDKAGVKKVEWTSFVAGPSLDILKGWMTTAAGENLIPFAPTMSTYVTADEATLRWKNTQAWYSLQGHFWIGNGPFYVNKAFPVEKSLTLLRYDKYPDSASRWAIFGKPMIPVVTVDGPGEVTIGQEAAYNVTITFEDQPYPADKIDAVKYLVFDSSNAVVTQGEATAGDAGVYTITLGADVTAKLTAGSNKLEVVTTSLAVSIPTITDFEFIAK
jgi:peptide/nickel transport system substrate-binding protein